MNINCPKCSHTMVRGFIPEFSHRSSVSFWVEGVPEDSFWAAGVKYLKIELILLPTAARSAAFWSHMLRNEVYSSIQQLKRDGHYWSN